ncbi:MAG: NAD-dependent epimerase/dehydratase family protein [Pseudomonadota bacterium]
MSSQKSPRIVIFGATGRVGRLLAQRLSEKGCDLFCTGRNEAALRTLPGEYAIIDLNAPTGNEAVIRSGDIVINTVHARYTSRIASLCPPDISRYIVIGSTRYRSRIPDRKADEVRDAAAFLRASDLPWVLLHPTMIYGAEGENNVQRMAALIRRFHFVPMPGGGHALIQPVHVLDVVEAVTRTIERPDVRDIEIDVGGPQSLPYAQFLHAIAQANRTWVKVVPLPLSLVRLAAKITTALPGVPTIRDAEVVRLQEDKDIDVTAAGDRLGLYPRSLEDGLRLTFEPELAADGA